MKNLSKHLAWKSTDTIPIVIIYVFINSTTNSHWNSSRRISKGAGIICGGISITTWAQLKKRHPNISWINRQWRYPCSIWVVGSCTITTWQGEWGKLICNVEGGWINELWTNNITLGDGTTYPSKFNMSPWGRVYPFINTSTIFVCWTLYLCCGDNCLSYSLGCRWD